VSPALGDRTYTARAEQADGAGNTGFSSPVTFAIDTVAPDTSIDSGPSGTVSSTSASFRFSSEPGATFECRRDSGDWSACQSPKDYASLGEGSHTFEVRATDAAGNVDSAAASSTWTVDTTPPQTTLDSPPSGTVSSTSATFDFSANDAGATFQCRLDGGDWGGCESPKGYSSLGDGPHTFEVRARDGVGNTDPTPASATWIVDTGPPETTIDSGPSGTVTGASVSFEFSANEPGSTFQCRRDGGDWAGCTSPESYGSLSTGEHSFEVRATDAAGNTDSTAAQRNFTVAEPDSPTESSGGGTRPGEDAVGGSGDGGGAAATGDGGGAPTATADQAVDSAAPDAAISLFSGQTIRAVVRRGLRVRLFSSEVGTATITVDLSGALARRLGLARRARRVAIGRRKLELSAPGPTAATVKLTRRGRAALRRARGPVTLRVRTVVADRLGNARVVTKRVRLRR
jgi:hypothetical protein